MYHLFRNYEFWNGFDRIIINLFCYFQELFLNIMPRKGDNGVDVLLKILVWNGTVDAATSLSVLQNRRKRELTRKKDTCRFITSQYLLTLRLVSVGSKLH